MYKFHGQGYPQKLGATNLNDFLVFKKEIETNELIL